MEKEKLLTTKEVAEYIDIALSTVRQYRVNRNGPVYIKVGYLVRYRKSDVDAWVDSRKPKD